MGSRLVRANRAWTEPGNVLLAAFGALCGASALDNGLYDLSHWGPAAVAILALLLALIVARPARVTPVAAIAVAALVLLAGWSLLSRGWAEFPDAATLEANRWILYAATLAVLVLLLRSAAGARLLLGAATAAVTGVGIYLVARLIFGHGLSLFLGGRLNDPIGYVNGQAGFLMLGFWPLVAVAERVQRPVSAACALAGATMLGGLLVLTEARGAALAFAASAAVLLALVPGRRVRAWALLFVLAAVLLFSGPLVDVYRSGGGAGPSADTVRHAGEVTLVAAVVVGLFWFAAGVLAAEVGKRSSPRARALARLPVVSLIMVALGTLTVAAVSARSISHRVSGEYRAFTHLRGAERGARFFSGAGNRYDYWRIALNEFRQQPLRGQGAGSYGVGYYRERRTTEDILQPHSLELQVLAELGLVGAALLAAFIGAVAAAFVRLARSVRAAPGLRGPAVAAGGMFFAWLAHTSVDWLHRIPAVTGLALAAAAVLLNMPRAEGKEASAPRAAHGRLAAVGVVAGCVMLVAGGISVLRQTLALHYRSQAQTAVARDPARALRRASASLELDRDAVETYYVKAATYARFDRYDAARDALLAAIRREPRRFVTWALLGDLATRRGDYRLASRAYARATELNPKDPTLAKHASDARTQASRTR